MGRRRDRPRIVFFGTGSPAAYAALDALVSRFAVVGVVLPRVPRVSLVSRFHLVRLRDPRRSFLDLVHVRSVPVLQCPRHAQRGFAATLRALEPDLVVVATFPYLLEPSVLAVPPCGAINLHPSLLPRHRGPDPLFWTYVGDDAETGVTVHWMDPAADTGPLLFQEAIALGRGRPVPDLYRDLSARGAALLSRSVEAIAAGTAPRAAQDERRATHEPRPDAGARRLDFSTWGAERAWHVLAGLGSGWGPLLHDARGHALSHGAAIGYTRGVAGRVAGTVQRDGRLWRLTCADGVVAVARQSRLRATRAGLAALIRRVC
jgi:methionyl-tRNA formyltransferase